MEAFLPLLIYIYFFKKAMINNDITEEQSTLNTMYTSTILFAKNTVTVRSYLIFAILTLSVNEN